MKKAVIYARVSSMLQVTKGNGIDSQISTCKERCKKNDIEIIQIFIDKGISGGTLDRKGLHDMIKFVKTSNQKEKYIDFVVVYDLDRMSRDIGGWLNIKKSIEEESNAFILSTVFTRDNSPEGELNENIKMSVHQYEKQNNRRRVISRQKARLKDGFWCFSTPPGYKYIEDKNKGGKILTKDSIITDYIGLGLEKFANKIICTKVDLLLYLQEFNLHTNQKKLVDYNFVFNMLTPQRLYFYAGFLNVPSWDINMVPGKHEPIISLETAEKIIRMKPLKKMNMKQVKEEVKHNMILRNYLYCEDCDKPLSGGPSKGSKGTIYNYYRCFNSCCERFNKSYNADEVHLTFNLHLKKYRVTEPIVEIIKETTKNILSNDNSIDIRKKNKQTELNLVLSKVTKFNDLLLKTDNEELIKNYEEKLSALLKTEKELVQEIEALNSYNLPIERINKEVDMQMENFNDLYKSWINGDDEFRQLLIRVALGSKIYYTKKSGIATPEISFIYAAFEAFNDSNISLVEITLFC